MEDSAIEAQLQKLEDTKKSNLLANAQAAPQKENISFDDFGKMDIRIVKILEAEKVAKPKN